MRERGKFVSASVGLAATVAMLGTWASALPLEDRLSFDFYPENQKEIVTVTMENDVVSNADRHYTSGLRVARLLKNGGEPDWMRRVLRRIAGDESPLYRYEVAFGQQLYTPEDLLAEERIEGDRPYAGWIYASIGRVERRGRVVDQVELSLGVVGPAALGEETQKLVHEFFASKDPQGWDNQLENEPTLQLYGQRNWWLLRGARTGPVQWDLVPYAGGAIGNVHLYANGGVTVSVGVGDRERFGTPRLGMLLPGNGYFTQGDGMTWQLFASAGGAAIGRNLFLDGNTFRSETSTVEKERFVSEAQIGLQFIWGNNRLSFVHVYRSKEFERQERAESYGALSYSLAY
ncbi:lipid A deacylase LpxR family protein [Pelagicoccus sp. SDUM812003]|uniref:lipid A deacylase LpxR family protein n=1 Tax=Pelagicoccus sp. SDUM812003 TaxID=3041267 RepID=UPI00280ECA1F|nr:lipid A deacylase LpxR family protein [Pelagicoccus sp. SDUM812003]MDQ8205107.1 lipid A deacylase LpxR family protein [Pelagicoccus sp. SDUM812003]